MILSDLRCHRCGADEVFAVWPGQEGERGLLFRLLPGRAVKGWCRTCWRKCYGPDPAPPRSGGKAES